MANLSWQYIAGFFDGEGHVGMHGRNNGSCSHIGIAQAGPEGKRLLTEMQEWLLQRQIPSRIQVKRQIPGHLIPYYLYISGRETQVKFLQGIIPYLRIKKVAAQDLCRYFTMFPSLKTGLAGKTIAKDRMEKYGLARNLGGFYVRRISAS